MDKRNTLIITIIALVGLIVITAGITFAFFNYAKHGTTDNSVTTGSITFLYTEVSGVGKGISLIDSFPMSDEQGKAQIGEGKVFDFKVESDTPSNSAFSYQVTARKKSDSTLDEDVVKMYLTEVNGTEEEILLDYYSNLSQTDKVAESTAIEKVLYNGKVRANKTNYSKNFRLRMWIDESTNFSSGEMNDKTFTVTVNVYANTNVVTTSLYKETILNGTDPVLTDNLVPVQISDNGTVTKADTDTAWYSYKAKNWANAVVLKDTSISYDDNDIIPEANIESYFVWIPRFRYKIFDTGSYNGQTSIESKVQIIDVVFENKNTAPSNGETVGSYLTHPAFTAFDVNGFWVGKFETGYDGAKTTTGAQVNSNDSSKIIIKPNVYSWRRITVGNIFKVCYDYLRDDESHMMKNTEWGAVAYLQHSSYGSAVSVRVNNNKNYITGYAGIEEPMLGYNGNTSIDGNRFEAINPNLDGTYTVNYSNVLSNVASTTGNKTGVYDMAGGSWEYVMGYTTGAKTVGGSSTITSIYPNFFTNSIWDKYYDKYTSTANTQYSKRILGDATGEMGPFESQKDPDGSTRYKSSWYGDLAYFAHSVYPWFARGGNWGYGASSGIFSVSDDTGAVNSIISFRIVLAP